MLSSLELKTSLWIFQSSGKKTLKSQISLVSVRKAAHRCHGHIWTAQQRSCSYCGVRIAEGLFFI